MRRAFQSLFYVGVGLSFLTSVDIAMAQAGDETDAGSPVANPVPLGDETITPMLADGLAPEEAQASSQRLQELRISDPNAELPSEERTQFVDQTFHEELDANGQKLLYYIAPDGTKITGPRSSTIFRALYGREAQQAIDEQIASIARPSWRNAALAFFISPRSLTALLQVASVAIDTLLFPTTTSPYSVPTPSVCASAPMDCAYAADGQGSGADIANVTVLPHSGYDYAASIMKDGSTYKMWWCASGHSSPDRIYYATSTTGLKLGAWSTPTVVFGPDTVHPTADFDGFYTCDPSVIKVGAMYYMYYGGNTTNPTTFGSITNRIGVAYSTDGVNWSRPLSGPMIDTFVSGTTTYGVGHPSATYVDGYVYLTYDDKSASPYGQIAMRSSDPYFQKGVEELQDCQMTSGCVWRKVASTSRTDTQRTPYLLATTGADWAYSPSTREFVLSINGVSDIWGVSGIWPYAENQGRGSMSSVRFFSKDLKTQPRTVKHRYAQWIEGPGLLHKTNGNLPTELTDITPTAANCNYLNLRVMNPGRDWNDPTDSSSLNTNATLNVCEQNLHAYEVDPDPATNPNVSNEILAIQNCGDLTYEGWDISSGVSTCRAWTAGVSHTNADDYDGDGKSDPTVFRPTTGVWWTLRSQTGQQHGVSWGLYGDQPVFGADYDGDGVADPAVKRYSGGVVSYLVLPSTGICPPPMVPFTNSRGCYFNPGWGSTDVPLPADFDGDGLTDIAARSTSGNIYYMRKDSSTSCASGFTATTYSGYPGCYSLSGSTGDKPLVGDYDGDGLSDRVFFSPSASPLPRISVYPSSLIGAMDNTHCATLNMASASGSGTAGPCYTNLNNGADVPVTGDFDGDNKTDIMWWQGSFPPRYVTWGTSGLPGGTCPYNFTYVGTQCVSAYFGASGIVPLAKRVDTSGVDSAVLFYAPTSQGYWDLMPGSTATPVGPYWVPGSGQYQALWGLTGDMVSGL